MDEPATRCGSCNCYLMIVLLKLLFRRQESFISTTMRNEGLLYIYTHRPIVRGFMLISGWKVEANYIIPKSEAMMCVVSLCSSRAMYLAVRTVSVTTPTKPMWELTQLVSLHQCMYSGHHSAICVCVYVYNVCLCLWVCVSTCMCVCRVCDVLV